jgi:hypothetical protein
MGEARRDALRVVFDRAIKLEFHGAKVSSDAGLFRSSGTKASCFRASASS